MKIGIVTYHVARNYGVMLQAYAMQTLLGAKGHDARLVHLRRPQSFDAMSRKGRARSLKGLIRALPRRFLRKRLERREERFETFLQEHLRLTDRYPNGKALCENPPAMDAFVCGSDQIWNLDRGINTTFFGDFVPDGVRLVSYAASMGNNRVPERLRDEVRRLLGRFDHLAVREESARPVIGELTGREVATVMDPTFLVEADHWRSLAVKPALDRPYIAFYSLETSPRISAIVRRVARLTRMPVVVLGKGGGFVLTCRSHLAIDSGPREFLGWLQHAALVLTNSFHATAFSIKLGSPFVTITHSTRNNRMADLLGGLGLEGRMVENAAALDAGRMESLRSPLPADLSERLDAKIGESRGYLERALA